MYYCLCCGYKTKSKSVLSRHLQTIKHEVNLRDNPIDSIVENVKEPKHVLEEEIVRLNKIIKAQSKHINRVSKVPPIIN